MGEILAMGALAASGAAFLAPVSRQIPRVALGALAFPIGASLYAITASVWVAVASRIDPVPMLVATAVVGGLVFGLAIVSGRAAPGFLVTLGVTVGLTLVAAAALWSVHLTRLTIDSMRYVLASVDFQDAVSAVHPTDLLKRQLGLPAWHALSSLTERRYVAGVGPLFGLSGAVLLGWLVWARTAGWDVVRRRWVVLAAIAFALTSNRLLYDWFYINTHIAMAVLVLVAVCGLWLAGLEGHGGWALPAGIALAGTLLLRPESPLVVALIVVAFAPELPDRWSRLWVSGPSSLVMVAWYGLVLWNEAPGGSEVAIDAPVLMGFAAFVGASVAVAATAHPRTLPLAHLGRRALLPVMLLALVAFSVMSPHVLIDSVTATALNVGYQGLWAFAWTVAVPLLAVALVVHRIPRGTGWSIVVTGYGILFFLLAFIRNSPWRLGSGDSGNRLLAHVFLVAVAFLVLAAVEDGEEESVTSPG